MSTFDAGRFTMPAPTVRSALPKWRMPANIDGNELVESGEFTPTAVTFPNGTHICEVEIDPDTGVTEVVRYSAVEELGYVLNPMLVAGRRMAAWRKASARRWPSRSCTTRTPARC